MALKITFFNESCQGILFTGRCCVAVKINRINITVHQLFRQYHIANADSRCESFAECIHNGHYCDYCANGTSQHEFHLYGKEAISMFFRNKFLFCQYSISSPIVLNSSQAEFIASYSSFHVMAIASLQQLTADGHIRRLTVRPK